MNYVYGFRTAILLLIGLQASSGQWDYPDRENNGTETPWGGACDNGRKQSPIDLSLKKSFRGTYAEFRFQNYNRSLRGAALANTGHSVEVAAPRDELIEVSGGGLPGIYVLEQIHWHWWSEHTIEEIRYPLEIHLVHRNKMFANISAAAEHKNGISVFGVLFHVTDRDNTPLSHVFENLQLIESNVGALTFVSQDVTARQFLPMDTKKYFRYEGSLTTPECAESVIWTVFQKSLPVTLNQVEQLMYIRKGDGNYLKSNYRSIQLTNNRAVTYIENVYTVEQLGSNTCSLYSKRSILMISVGLMLMALYRQIV